MKRVLLPLLFIVNYLTVLGQGPESFEYHAIVRNPAGELVATKPVSIQFSILKGSISGEIIYSERHIVTTSQAGLISLSVGNGTEKEGDIKSLNWADDSYFLKVEIDAAGGTAFVDMGTTQMVIISEVMRPRRAKKETELLADDELFIIRKYVGRFLDYRHSGPDTYAGPNLIWIKTTMESTYGKISAYGKTCKFSAGDNLYLKRTLYSPGEISGYWIYQIENDSSIYYRASDFQHDKKVAIESWFQ